MHTWSRAPLTRILLPLMLGIIAGMYAGLGSAHVPLVAAMAALLLYLLVDIRYQGLPWVRRWWPGLLAALVCFFSGMAILLLQRADLKPDFAGRWHDKADYFSVRLTDQPVEKEKSWKCLATIKQVQAGPYTQAASGDAILYLPKDSSSQPQYGDELLIRNRLTPVPAARNPEEFDYKGFLASKNIYLTAFLKEGDYNYTGRHQSPFWAFIYNIRNAVNSSLNRYVGSADERGIAKALITGDEGDISDDLLAAYADSGTLHVLSVSGLHITALLAVLMFLCKPLESNKPLRLLRLLLLLGILWLYAFLAGFSAPVARSVVMASGLLFGRSLQRVSNIYNSLAIAALILLLAEPMAIAQVSFQLSFIALLGIVWLQPYIHAWLTPRHKALKRVWSLVSVSLAAQLAVFPLSVYYFNQVPLYFLPANLIIIPYSSGILFATAGFLLCFSWYAPLATVAGKLLTAFIYGLNAVALFFDRLPHATLDGLYLRPAGCAWLYLCLVLLALAFIYKRKRWLLPGLASLLILLLMQSFVQVQHYRQAQLNVWAIPKTFALSVRAGSRMYLISDKGLLQNTKQRKYYINRFAYSQGIGKEDITGIDSQKDTCLQSAGFCYRKPVLQLGDSTFIIIQDAPSAGQARAYSGLASWVLCAGAPARLEPLLDARKDHIRRIIATPDSKLYRLKQWETACRKYGIPFLDMQKENNLCYVSGLGRE